MRILAIGSMYPPHYLGGQEIVWRQATIHQRAAGHEVRVLTSNYRRPDVAPQEEWDDDVHRDLRWYWHEHEFPPLSLRRRLGLERHNAQVLERHVAELRPEAVIWWSLGGMSVSLLERLHRAGLPALGVVCDDWMLYADKVDQWTRTFARLPALRAVAARVTGIPTRFDPGPAARWLFISEHVRGLALRRWELADTGIANPGVDMGLFRQQPPKPWRWRILYAGRIDPRKGIDLAVRALAELPEAATLTIDGAGDRQHRDELGELVRELSLDERVRFRESARTSLPKAYADADAVVFPVTWEEPWGLVPLEAMAVGRPVVATGRGGSGEYLRHEENCLIFDDDDPAALARSLERLGGDEGLCGRLVAGGLETAAKLTESRFNDAVLAELQSLGGLRRAPVDNRAA